MKFAILLGVPAAIALSFGSAQATIVPIAAPNGITVDVGTDEFAGKKAISSPILEFAAEPGGHGKFQVEVLITKGQLQNMRVLGYVMYPGKSWRFYNGAIYRGGDVAAYTRSGSEVITCKPTRFSPDGCSFSEDFSIDTSVKEASAHSTDGTVEMRVTGGSGDSFDLSIPLPYFEAVDEVSKSIAGQ